MTGFLYKWSRRKSTDFTTSLRIKPFCHSFILILPFLHFASNAVQCQPWPFNGQFWNSVGYLHNFPNLATTKWLASTHQPNMKLVIGLNSQLSRQFQPKRMAGAGSIVNFMVGWKVEASHFIVVALGNHTSSQHYSKMAHWKARVGIWRHWKQNQGMQKDGRCCLNHQFHGGLKGWG